MHSITFANPWILLGLIIIPLLIGWWLWRYRRQKPTLQYSDLDQFEGSRKSLRQRLYPLGYLLRLLALTALIVALARPQSTFNKKKTKVEGIDVVLALDVSGSMKAQDFRPNRLEAAKKVAANFIEGRKNDRIALVVFAGEAYTQIPLTIDHHVLLSQLAKVKNGSLVDGTALGDGLATAINRIKDSPAKNKVIILLTDGINNRGSVDPKSAAEIAALYDIRLYTIGVGSRGMAPYPATDPWGRAVMQNIPVEIDEGMLRQMAETTQDGHYFRATNKESLQHIFDDIDQMEKTKIDVTQYSQNHDEYLPFLLFGLLCLALELALRFCLFRD